MSDESPVFYGSIADFDEYEWEAPLAEAKEPTCEYYVTPLSNKSRELQEAGDEKGWRVFRFVSVLCSFSDRYDDRTAPYHAMWTNGDGSRSLIPEDFIESDLDLIAILLEKVRDSALKGRMADVLWILRKDHEAARIAVESFADAALRLIENDGWTWAIPLFQRSLQLGKILGWESYSFKLAEEAAMGVVRSKRGNDSSYMSCQMIEMLIGEGAGDFSEMGQIAQEHAEAAVTSESEERPAERQRRAEFYWEAAASSYHSAKEADRSIAAQLGAAEAIFELGRLCLQGESPCHSSAASFFARAVEALRRAKGAPEKVQEWKDALYASQEKLVAEMSDLSTSIDITEGVRVAEKIVEADNLHEALMRLAFGIDVTDVERLRESVEESIKQAPLAHFMSTSHVDSRGRVTNHIAGVSPMDVKDSDSVFEAQMFKHAAQFHWSFIVQAFIDPARHRVWRDHRPALRDLVYLVRRNPFIPPGHERIFLRGLYAGLSGDFIVASHLLTPQIENSIRYVLESSGADVTNLRSDLTQPVKLLGPLLGMQETKQIFGESLVFALRGILIEKSAYGFRDRLAHGLVSEHDCYGLDAIYLWWLTLRLSLRLCPTVVAAEQQQIEDQEISGEEE